MTSLSDRNKAEILALLFVVNAFSVLDRTIFSITAPAIATDLRLSDAQIGALAGIMFSFFYAIMGLPLARIADKGNRGLVVSLSVIAWSTITMLTAATQSFLQLALARMGVAVGEAGATPAAHSMLSEKYSLAERPKAMAIHSSGAPVGAGLALIFGGFLTAEFGWRGTFVLLGAPGLIIGALVLLRLNERGRTIGYSAPKNGNYFVDIRTLFSVAAYRWLLVGFSFGAFIVASLLAWLPTYFIRGFSASPKEVGLAFGIAYGLGSFSGMILGGLLGNRLVKKDARWAMWIAGSSYLFAAPFAASTLLTQNETIAYSLAFMMSAATTVAYGPAFAMIQELAETRLRALASAISLLFANLLGAGLGPLFVGLLSDAYGFDQPGASLRWALITALALIPIPAIAYFFSAAKLKQRIVVTP